jgi:hypothetical protein
MGRAAGGATSSVSSYTTSTCTLPCRCGAGAGARVAVLLVVVVVVVVVIVRVAIAVVVAVDLIVPPAATGFEDEVACAGFFVAVVGTPAAVALDDTLALNPIFALDAVDGGWRAENSLSLSGTARDLVGASYTG